MVTTFHVNHMFLSHSVWALAISKSILQLGPTLQIAEQTNQSHTHREFYYKAALHQKSSKRERICIKMDQ